MNGQQLKKLFKESGKSMKDIASELDMSPQALNTLFGVEDLKSGLLEKVYNILDIDPFPRKPLVDIKDVEDSFNDSDVLKRFLEIIENKDKQIEELNHRIAMLTDKLLGL